MILPILDLIVLIFFIINLFIPITMPLLLGAVYLILKGVIFLGDFLSILDFMVGAYIVLILFGVANILVINYLIIIYFIYKTIVSFI